MFGFMKNTWGITKKAVWSSIFFLPNDNFLEQELQNFNRGEMGNEEPLGNNNNGEEK